MRHRATARGERERDHRRDPEADQREARDAEQRRARDDDHQRSGRGGHGARADGRHRPEARDHAVAGQPPRRHRQREARVGRGGGGRARPHHVAQVDRAPVGARTLSEDRTEADDADQQDGAGRPRQARRIVCRERRRQPARRSLAYDRQHDGHDPEVNPRVEIGVGGEHAHRRADDPADAPGAVQTGHERTPQRLLQRQPLRVHGDVGHPGQRAVDQQRDTQPAEGRRERGQRKRHGERGDQHTGDRAATEPVHERARRRHRQQRAQRRHEQRQPERPRAQPKPLADPRDARREAAVDRTVDGEDRHHRDVTPISGCARNHSAIVASATTSREGLRHSTMITV